MAKSNKPQIRRSKVTQLHRPAKGKISKLPRKIKNPSGKSAKIHDRHKKLKERNLSDTNGDDSIVVKKRPSKVELKSVIEALKKDPNLLLVRKALKYIPFYLKSEGLTKKLSKEIIRLWAEASEKIRVICLLCLIRIYTKLRDDEKKHAIIKKLYTTFLDKCRITKHETMSMIGFMRHSLIELYKIDPKVAFKQAQTTCQQLIVTLKNAHNHKNEETYKTVLNWQFANCLILLSQLISSLSEDSPIRSLTQQIIQLNLGAINLLTSPRYYPYYCHLIENLVHLSISVKVFIPVLPLMLSIVKRLNIPLEKKIRSKNGKKNGADEGEGDDENEHEHEQPRKEYNIEILNHVSLDEAHNPGYQEAVLSKIYDLMLLYLSSQCHKIAFPELVFLPCVQLKKWLKSNPGQPTQKMKILLDKIKSDCEKIEEARQSVDFAFTNYTAVDAWEKRMLDSNKLSTPKLIQIKQ